MNKINTLENIYRNQRNQIEKHNFIDIDRRILILKKLKKLLQEQEKHVSEALFKDLNKHENEVYISEISLVYSEINLYIKKLKQWTKLKRVKTPFYLWPAKSRIMYEPLGGALIISPWNYPLMLSLVPIVNAIGAGNRVIIKPSEYCVNFSNWLFDFINKNFENDLIYCANFDLENAKWLLDKEFDVIHFTGSTNIGKIVAEKAAKKLTPVILELGGKSPTVVCDDTNLDNAVENIFYGKVINSGQTCTAHDYALVQENIVEKFIQKFNLILHEQLGNEPLKNSSLPKIISQKHFDRLINMKPDLVYDAEQLKIYPLAYTTDEKDKMMQEEIFGPILPIIPFKDINEAIDFINVRDNPLASYLFSSSKMKQKLFKSKVQSGSLIINTTTMHLANSYLPLGGVKNSGLGKYRGFEGFKAFSHAKSIFYKRNTSRILFLLKRPFTGKKVKIIKSIIK
ncbi:aldehyde dehydrogenase family protein [Mycoplasmopsis opalescens]|uniref:aldehyde dehydrogenase family protein n=1 Tax=Mycoplasmopsis opalescens TaxID=114886 RepID=UPI0004A74870|nr:aldehyde dehydrogenase family protein [Mycoplasmopsis opalescens]